MSMIRNPCGTARSRGGMLLRSGPGGTACLPECAPVCDFDLSVLPVSLNMSYTGWTDECFSAIHGGPLPIPSSCSMNLEVNPLLGQIGAADHLYIGCDGGFHGCAGTLGGGATCPGRQWPYIARLFCTTAGAADIPGTGLGNDEGILLAEITFCESANFGLKAWRAGGSDILSAFGPYLVYAATGTPPTFIQVTG